MVPPMGRAGPPSPWAPVHLGFLGWGIFFGKKREHPVKARDDSWKIMENWNTLFFVIVLTNFLMMWG